MKNPLLTYCASCQSSFDSVVAGVIPSVMTGVTATNLLPEENRSPPAVKCDWEKLAYGCNNLVSKKNLALTL